MILKSSTIWIKQTNGQKDKLLCLPSYCLLGSWLLLTPDSASFSLGLSAHIHSLKQASKALFCFDKTYKWATTGFSFKNAYVAKATTFFFYKSWFVKEVTESQNCLGWKGHHLVQSLSMIETWALLSAWGNSTSYQLQQCLEYQAKRKSTGAHECQRHILLHHTCMLLALFSFCLLQYSLERTETASLSQGNC